MKSTYALILSTVLALPVAAQAVAETGAFATPPPLSDWVDKRFLPVLWKR